MIHELFIESIIKICYNSNKPDFLFTAMDRSKIQREKERVS